jgi:hypothetical protein
MRIQKRSSRGCDVSCFSGSEGLRKDGRELHMTTPRWSAPVRVLRGPNEINYFDRKPETKRN